MVESIPIACRGKKGKHALDMSAKILSGQQTGNNRNSNYFVRTLMNMAQRSCDRR